MNVLEYVKENYETLPKSTFNEEEIVIVFVMTDENHGWGHHSYSAYGIDKDSAMLYCWSSGCSCNGSCGMDHVAEQKTFEIEPTEFPGFNDPESINFSDISTSFSDY